MANACGDISERGVFFSQTERRCLLYQRVGLVVQQLTNALKSIIRSLRQSYDLNFCRISVMMSRTPVVFGSTGTGFTA